MNTMKGAYIGVLQAYRRYEWELSQGIPNHIALERRNNMRVIARTGLNQSQSDRVLRAALLTLITIDIQKLHGGAK